jgi:DNA-binding XRE family transcriptional regulator
VAQLLDMSMANLNLITKGDQYPRPEDAKVLCRLFGITLDELYSEDPSSPTRQNEEMDRNANRIIGERIRRL